MRIAVTGANGFIGQAVCQRLVQAGHEVIALVRREFQCRGVEVRHLEDPVRGFENLRVPTLDGMVHLLARTHRGEAVDAATQREFETLNVAATQAAYRFARAAGSRQFVFLSSAKVFGEASPLTVAGVPRRFTVSDHPAPRGPYGVTKLAAERWLMTQSATDGVGVTILRPPLVYGPGMKGNLRTLLRAIDLFLPLPLASIRNLRSLVHRDNVSEAILRVVTSTDPEVRVFTLADMEVSTPHLIRLLGAGLKRRPLLFRCPPAVLRGLAACTGQTAAIARLSESMLVDSTEITHALAWRPMPPANAFQAIAAEFRAEHG